MKKKLKMEDILKPGATLKIIEPADFKKKWDEAEKNRKEAERIANLPPHGRCPSCKSKNTTFHKITEPFNLNTPLGGRHRKQTLFSYHLCGDCGVMFQLVGKKKDK